MQQHRHNMTMLAAISSSTDALVSEGLNHGDSCGNVFDRSCDCVAASTSNEGLMMLLLIMLLMMSD
eukprot:5802384-Amphidinium_carterae.1